MTVLSCYNRRSFSNLVGTAASAKMGRFSPEYSKGENEKSFVLMVITSFKAQ